MIGTNVASIQYYGSQLAFVNVMKMSSVWLDAGYQPHTTLNLDAQGWIKFLAPGQIGRKLMLRSNADHYPAGQYLVRYKGKGTLKFQFSARAVSEKPGEIVLQVTPSGGGIQMDIVTTDPADYLRDIVITMPGFYQTPDAFYPPFLENLKPYSALRWMDWMGTNGSWWTTWAGPSAAITDAIRLCNALKRDAWFCIPHGADNDYVTQFANLLHATLAPPLKVYVEHSNEIWNGRFTQSGYCQQQGQRMLPKTNLNGYHAFRTREIGQIFKSILGDRVVTVLGAQAASRAVAYSIPEVIAKFGTHGIDAIAIAPYIGLTPNVAEAKLVSAWTLDQLFDHIRTVLMPQVTEWIAMHMGIANIFGCKLLAYEGGHHLVGIFGGENNEALNNLFFAAQRDPRMKQVFLDYFDMWKAAGGGLFCHYHDTGYVSKFGSWGCREWLEQPRSEAPKFDAILTWIERNTAIVNRRVGPAERRQP